MELTELPESLLVLGGGYVGLEQAQVFAELGSQVTLLTRSRLASHEEPEVAPALAAALEARGIRVVEHATVSTLTRDPVDALVTAKATVGGAAETFRGQHVLAALGRRPVTNGLHLDAMGISTGARGEVPVDPGLRTSNPRIWAAGDVTAHHDFVYVAAAHGALAVDNAFTGSHRQIDYRHLPRVVFTNPAIAAVGATEEQAAAAGIPANSRLLPLEHVPRARVNRDTRGFVKVVAHAHTGRILGITAVASEAGELAAAGGYILEAGMTVSQVANLWCPYLTMTEGIKLACQSFTTDISQLSCCAA
jgi:mercuric reductase